MCLLQSCQETVIQKKTLQHLAQIVFSGSSVEKQNDPAMRWLCGSSESLLLVLPALHLAVGGDAGWFTVFRTGPKATLLARRDVNTFSLEVTVNFNESAYHVCRIHLRVSMSENPQNTTLFNSFFCLILMVFHFVSDLSFVCISCYNEPER